MANRNTLAVNKLEDFKQWLIDNGWKIQQTKGKYEVLRARKETEKLPLLVYKKDKDGLVHLSVSDWNLQYVEQFINSKKQKVETAWVIQRDDGKYWCGFDGFIGQHIFTNRIIDGLNTQTPTYKYICEEIRDYGAVLKRLGVDLSTSLCSYLSTAKSLKMPIFESISRCRRKILETRPDLESYKTHKARDTEQEKYKEYNR